MAPQAELVAELELADLALEGAAFAELLAQRALGAWPNKVRICRRSPWGGPLPGAGRLAGTPRRFLREEPRERSEGAAPQPDVAGEERADGVGVVPN